jgi:hypothetical protein
MQIEQVIAGVNGDVTAQAIQLRMRSNGQHIVSGASVRAFDAAGANEVVLENMTTDVDTGLTGRRVLLATPSFANYTDVPLVADFIMDPIPEAYLAAGRLTFETSNGSTTYWGLSWGGSSYTGTNTGVTFNDADGNFNPPVNVPLPSTSTSALLFQGTAGAPSTTNLADYALTEGPALFTNNAGAQFAVTVPFVESADFNEDTAVDGRDFLIWQRNFGAEGGVGQGDANDTGTINAADLAVWERQFGAGIAPAPSLVVPEPTAAWLLLGFVSWFGRRSCARD